MSIFELINKHLLSGVKVWKNYTKGDNRNPSTIEHVATSMVIALFVCFLGMISEQALILYPVSWVLYSPFKEFVLDRKKQAGDLKSNVYAQVIERSVGFVLALPLIAVCILK